jgi:hypothetical protein
MTGTLMMSFTQSLPFSTFPNAHALTLEDDYGKSKIIISNRSKLTSINELFVNGLRFVFCDVFVCIGSRLLRSRTLIVHGLILTCIMFVFLITIGYTLIECAFNRTFEIPASNH